MDITVDKVTKIRKTIKLTQDDIEKAIRLHLEDLGQITPVQYLSFKFHEEGVLEEVEGLVVEVIHEDISHEDIPNAI